MNTLRLLLPFTHGVKTHAIEYAVLLAKSRNATLVPLSLVQIPKECVSKGARLEHIQQSKDFLEAVAYQAAKNAVPIEKVELFTSDVVRSISSYADESDCVGVLLFVSDREEVFLDRNQVKSIVSKVAGKHHIIHLQSIKRQNGGQKLLKRISQLIYKGEEQEQQVIHGVGAS